ncbi:MAG TPA: 2-oxoglutarate dehydrogenase E1 component [Pirellulaceae bacterium]|nr:2-oxoglutarate dehydrogenase E1 component [Pirellulaceae bacterium]HMO92418.1 2-oxoglutarate dehydrogenase E1 component [Pirellulaceae bacterium]HMP69537.1 2-oxoglutarate dehydrogenase E1 component [Pirellulaceae bacterium]
MNVFSQQYIDELYEQFLKNPQSLNEDWRAFFTNMENNGSLQNGAELSSTPHVRRSSDARYDDHRGGKLDETAERDDRVAQLQDRVDQLIRGFRVRGHLEAKVDPLGIPRPTNRELHPESYGLLPSDMKKKFSTRTIYGENFRPLEEIVDQLRATYCRSIGAQFMHIDDHIVRDWLQKRMEGTMNRIELSRKAQIRILTRLTDAVTFEEFVRRKFMGAKTFSLEGAETLIPLLDLALEKAGEHGAVEVVLGMAHRGRLNVLANLLGKRTENIFWSFDDPDPDQHRGSGDVLYHLGHSTDWRTAAGKRLHISLCFNPSHLEFVNPVAMGRCRAKQDRVNDSEHSKVMNILIHGDAAFAGEGIVQETLNMSQLAGYKVGGTLHVIVNNQIGFTTVADDSRSTTYATDVAKMLQVPIFHVNGEDPEAVAQVVDLSMEFRRKFKRDVVIDMYCYRRLGHNESDEPRFTQPIMYKTIDKRPTIRDSYLQHLLKLGEVSQEEADQILELRKSKLEADYAASTEETYKTDYQSGGGYWVDYFGGPEPQDPVDTNVLAGKLSYAIQKSVELPASFQLHKKLERVFQLRQEMAEGKRNIDWATAELAAMATLAMEGHAVRLSGQDCGRGTFSQRHAVLHDVESGQVYTPLKHLSNDQAPVEIINSPLSETGILGFEYGYSLDRPESLVMWEAQFGDFYNVAQVIVDQFIASAEDKWKRLSGLVMLLPHGFEGGGPEHCSARLERFLTLSAGHNMQVCYPSSASQYFHLLRRQVKRHWRKPLIVMTPKSLLREELVASPMSEFVSGRFHRVLPDPVVKQRNSPEKILLCTGKIGVELIKERQRQQRDDIAVVRMEQLYPLPTRELEQVLSAYPEGTPVVWVQEEPRNMGAFYFIKINFEDCIGTNYPIVKYLYRPESASPSTGSKKAHLIEHNELISEAFQPIRASV